MLLNCGVGEDSWESFGRQGDPASPFWRRLTLGFLWREWCWSWNSSTLATSCKELTHWKRLWCWEGLGAGGEGMTEDEMAGWYHWLDGCESEWTPGLGNGQGGLACCDSWGREESDTTEQLNWMEGPFVCFFGKSIFKLLLFIIVFLLTRRSPLHTEILHFLFQNILQS